MATSNGQRVVAFILAMLFLLTTIGATGYVLWEINRDEGGLVTETTPTETADASQADTCGSQTYDAVEPRPIPETVTADGEVTELQTIDIKEGDGEEVQAGDCVAALYYGTLASDGTNFDGNYAEGTPIEFSLNGVIQGWQQGIPGMKVGGVRRLVIPAELAYGEQEAGSIPANSALIFEVEIIAARRGE